MNVKTGHKLMTMLGITRILLIKDFVLSRLLPPVGIHLHPAWGRLLIPARHLQRQEVKGKHKTTAGELQEIGKNGSIRNC